jgi:hypothetical protein
LFFYYLPNQQKNKKMANSSQDTSNSHSQHIQYNSIGMPIQPQQGQPRDKIQQVGISSYEGDEQ